jgi:hypothetical protein
VMHISRRDPMHPENGVYYVPAQTGKAEENGVPFERTERGKARMHPSNLSVNCMVYCGGVMDHAHS